MANATSTQLQELYVAYFGRAADPTGLDYWTEKGITTAKFAADMHAQAEFKDVYGSLSTESQVNQIYKNLFDREADVTGLTYWTQEINLGKIQLAEIAVHLIWAAQNNSGSADDKTALTNRTEAAIAYTAKVKETTAAILAYQPTSTDPWVAGVNITEGVTYLSTIDKDTPHTAAGIATSVATVVSNPSVTGKTYTLTTGTDVITGTAGDDTFDGGLSSTNMTFTSSDRLDGGDGTDTINVTQNTTGTSQLDQLKNIETIKGTFSAVGTVSLLGSSGVTSVTNNNSTATGTFSNIRSGASAGLKLSNTASGGTFTFAAADVTGSADSATLTLENVTAGTVTLASIETLNLVSSGSANVLTTLTAADATTINVTGSQNINAGTANTVATTVDASALTGGLTFITNSSSAATITGGSGNDTITSTGGSATIVTIKGGAGNDTITHSANLATTDVIDGGEGTDTLASTTALLQGLTINTTAATITNIEAITVTDSYTDNTSTIDVVAEIQASGINTVTLANASATAGADVITAAEDIVLGSGTQTLNLGASLAGNQSHLGGNLTITDTGSGTTDSLTIANKSLNSTTSTNVDLADVAGTTNANITSTGFENVTLDTGAGTTDQLQGFPTITITPDDTSADVSFTVKGNNSLDVSTSLTTTSTGLMTVDASAMKAQTAGTTTFDIAATSHGTSGTGTITGSEGDDRIVIGNFATTINGGGGNDALTGGTLADTISGGAGNDTLTGSGGNDTISGGAGNDTITATTAGNYTITGGAGVDSVNFGGTLTNADSFDGGDGIDTMEVNNTSVTTINALSVSGINTLNSKINNVEKLDFGSSLAQNIDLGRLDQISDIILDNLGGNVTISGIEATNNILIKATTSQTLGLTLVDATGTSDVININLQAAALINANSVTAANVETINIKGDDAAVGNSSTINVMTLVATKAKDIVVTGNDGLNLTNTGNTKVTSFDASAVAANDALDTAANMAVTFVSANTSTTAAVSIKGGAGNDALTGNNSIDTISGGAGADTLTASSGNDVYTGGAGNDTMSFSGALLAANSGTTATFDGGAGTDIVDISTDAATIVDADFRGITSIETLTTGAGANSITLAANADATGITTITGGAAVDTIDISSVDFDNAVTIDGAAGADVITLSTSTDQVATFLMEATDGVTASSTTFAAATIAANDTITFATGVAGAAVEITGFTAGTDKIDFTNTGAATTGIGSKDTDMAENTHFFLSGDYVNNTGVFTITDDGVGDDTLLYENEGTALNDDIDTGTNFIVLIGVDSDNLTAGTFV